MCHLLIMGRQSQDIQQHLSKVALQSLPWPEPKCSQMSFLVREGMSKSKTIKTLALICKLVSLCFPCPCSFCRRDATSVLIIISLYLQTYMWHFSSMYIYICYVIWMVCCTLKFYFQLTVLFHPVNSTWPFTWIWEGANTSHHYSHGHNAPCCLTFSADFLTKLGKHFNIENTWLFFDHCFLYPTVARPTISDQVSDFGGSAHRKLQSPPCHWWNPVARHLLKWLRNGLVKVHSSVPDSLNVYFWW